MRCRPQLLIASAATAALLFALPAHANLLTNGSFETVSTPYGSDSGQDLPVTSTAITGWTVALNDVAPLLNSSPYGVTAQDGITSLDLQSYNDGSPYGAVRQTASTTPNDKYALTFYIGVQNSIGIAVGPASVSVIAGNNTQTFTNTLTAPGNQWQQFTLPFTATDATTSITLAGTSTAGGAYIGLDNVVLTDLGPAPEPASLTLLTLATPLLLRRRSRS